MAVLSLITSKWPSQAVEPGGIFQPAQGGAWGDPNPCTSTHPFCRLTCHEVKKASLPFQASLHKCFMPVHIIIELQSRGWPNWQAAHGDCSGFCYFKFLWFAQDCRWMYWITKTFSLWGMTRFHSQRCRWTCWITNARALKGNDKVSLRNGFAWGVDKASIATHILETYIFWAINTRLDKESAREMLRIINYNRHVSWHPSLMDAQQRRGGDIPFALGKAQFYSKPMDLFGPSHCGKPSIALV